MKLFSNLLKRREISYIRFPRLDTVLMVERFILDHGGEFNKKTLWETLPKKMMYQTYSITIEYLLESGKIAVDRRGKICWIWNPEMVKRYLKKPHLRAR